MRRQDVDKPWVKKLVAAFQHDNVKEFIDKRFKGAVIAGWKDLRYPKRQRPRSRDFCSVAFCILRWIDSILEMATPAGLEPATYCLEGNCSIQLS